MVRVNYINKRTRKLYVKLKEINISCVEYIVFQNGSVFDPGKGLQICKALEFEEHFMPLSEWQEEIRKSLLKNPLYVSNLRKAYEEFVQVSKGPLMTVSPIKLHDFQVFPSEHMVRIEDKYIKLTQKEWMELFND
jgi:hypothetical protein